MEFRLLRYFIVVAEELHLARAAERLGIEQSPVSRAMRDLERLLGVQLFDRSTRQTRLTWAGKVLLGEARCVLAAVDPAAQATKGAAQGYQGAVCASVSATACLIRLLRESFALAESIDDEEAATFTIAFNGGLRVRRR